MKEMLSRLPLAVLVAVGLVACEQTPAGLQPDAELITEVVLTQGVPAPPRPPNLPVGLSNFEVPQFATLGGSNANPVTLTPTTCSEGSSAEITVTFRVSGNQAGTATFKVRPTWTYDGSWTGTGETVVEVGPQSPGTTTHHPVTLTITNNSSAAAGASNFDVQTFALANSNPTGAKLDGSATATVHVAFAECGSAPVAPTLTLPDDIVLEATSSAGAVHPNALTEGTSASDDDGPVPVTCERATGAGTTFPIGETIINCRATGAGGTTDGSYSIYVQDTTAPVFSAAFPVGIANLVAADINGLALDMSQFDTSAEDKGPNGEPGNVSGPVTVSCTVDAVDADGYQVGIGENVEVSCTATDAALFRAPGSEHVDAPNSWTQTFNVFVGLDLSTTCGFEAPLKNEPGPYSAHKGNSTIPHKVCPPAYADGTLATDLAGGLKLVLKWEEPGGDGEEVYEDPATGSTVWRYDEDDEHYIFNAKTSKNWANGTWMTKVSYAGIELAATYIILK